MARFTLPRDIYHGKGCLEELKNLKGKKAILVVGGGSMKRQGFLDKAVNYLKEAGMEVQLFEGVEPDPSVETVMKGAEAMRAFGPDWIVAMGGGSPIDAAKAMWAFYEYPDVTFEDLCIPFNFPELRQKAKYTAGSCYNYYFIFQINLKWKFHIFPRSNLFIFSNYLSNLSRVSQIPVIYIAPNALSYSPYPGFPVSPQIILP